MNTVEAIQVGLGRGGYILFPGTPENPPETISCEELHLGDFRVFKQPNELGPVFTYDKDHAKKVWVRRHGE